MTQPSKLAKVGLIAKHMVRHKGILTYDDVEVADDDQSYQQASERFLEFQAQMQSIISHSESLRSRLMDTITTSAELAEDFARVSRSGPGSVSGAAGVADWTGLANKQAALLKSMLEEGNDAAKRYLGEELDQRLLLDLKAEVASYVDAKRLMDERFEMRMEVQHYSKKLKELDENPKAHTEKKERNREKYAQASQTLRDQTNHLIDVFGKAETMRQRLLCDDLKTVAKLQLDVFEVLAANLRRATEDMHYSNSRSKLKVMVTPPLSSMPVVAEGGHAIAGQRGRAGPGANAGGGHGSGGTGSGEHYPPDPPMHRLAEVSLDDDAPTSLPAEGITGGARYGVAGVARYSAPTGRATPGSLSPTVQSASHSPGLGSISGIDDVLSEEGTNDFEESHAESILDASGTASGDWDGHSAPLDEDDDDLREGEEEEGDEEEGDEEEEEEEEDSANSADEESVGEVPRLGTGASFLQVPPGQIAVRALFDYEATEEGDLSFSIDDIIFTDKSTWAADGWLEGTFNGMRGMFPSNYTEPV